MTLGDGTKLQPAELKILSQDEEHNRSTTEIKIREGKYHQIKRMMASRGKPVTYLKRISFGPLTLDPDLEEGSWRALTEEEIQALFRQ